MARLLKLAALAGALGGVWVAGATLVVERAARGRTWSDAAAIPARRVGLVLGCARVLGGGQRNSFFDTRIAAAARLFHAGKVEYLVVSGDNHVRGYDEPQDMKDALVQAGVPPQRVYCDYAGFRTLDSIVRVREIFGQRAITVVSQEFHNQRGILIAGHRGGEADERFKTKCREVGAGSNMWVVFFVLRREPRFLGKKVRLPA